jgi:hypothetical protein
MAVSYVANALGGTTTTTSFSITLPATVAGDTLILEYTHRGLGDAALGGTSITVGGLTWTEAHDQPYSTGTFSGKTYYTRATGNHSGQTITGAALTNSCAAIVTVYRGAATGNPLTAATIVGEQNIGGNETQAEITTDRDGAFIVLVVANSPDFAITNQACTTPGVLTARAERLSTGGTDTSISHASALQTTRGATGAFTWSQTDGSSGSWAYAIKPEVSFDIEQGSFARSTEAADLTAQRLLAVDFRTFTHVGQAVTFDVSTAGRSGSPAPLPHLGLVLVGGAYNLVLEYGAFTRTGQDAGLLAGKLLTAEYGAFTHTGQDARLEAGELLTAEYGAFTHTGQAAGLTAQRLLTAEYGAFTHTGQDVGLAAQRLLTAEYAAFTHTGRDVTLTVTVYLGSSGSPASLPHLGLLLESEGLGLVLEYGTFTYTGQDAGLIASELFTAEYGAFTHTGQAAGLTAQRLLTAEYAAFAHTGQDVTLTASVSIGSSGYPASLPHLGLVLVGGGVSEYTINADYGTFALVGSESLNDFEIDAVVEPFTLAGQAVDLVAKHQLSVEYGAFVHTGQVVNLDYALDNRSLDYGIFTFTGMSVGSTVQRLLEFSPRIFACTTYASDLVARRGITLDTGTFAHTGGAIDFSASSFDTIYLTLTGQSVAGIALQPFDPAFPTIVGQTITLAKGIPLTVEAAIPTITAQDIALTASNAGSVLPVTAAVPTIGGQSVSLSIVSSRDPAAPSITGQSIAMYLADDFTLPVASATLALTPQNVGLTSTSVTTFLPVVMAVPTITTQNVLLVQTTSADPVALRITGSGVDLYNEATDVSTLGVDSAALTLTGLDVVSELNQSISTVQIVVTGRDVSLVQTYDGGISMVVESTAVFLIGQNVPLDRRLPVTMVGLAPLGQNVSLNTNTGATLPVETGVLTLGEGDLTADLRDYVVSGFVGLNFPDIDMLLATPGVITGVSAVGAVGDVIPIATALITVTGIGATGYINYGTIWGVIIDEQPPGWVPVIDEAASGWVPVVDAQTTTWQAA